MIDKSLFQLPGVHGILAMLLVTQLAVAGCVIGQTLALAQCLAQAWAGAPIEQLAWLAGVFAACFLAAYVLRWAQETIMDRYASARVAELRKQLLEVVFSSTSGATQGAGAASLAATTLDGLAQVEVYIRIILPKIIGMVAISMPLLVCAFVLDWVSGIILLVMYPTIIMFMVILGRSAASHAQAQYAQYQVLSNHFIDTLRGLPTIAAFGAGTREGKGIFSVSERFRKATVDTLRVATLSSAMLDLIATLGVAAVAILLAFRLMDGTLPLFVGLAVLVLAPEYFKPIRAFAADYHASLDGKNALVAVNNLLKQDAQQRAEYESVSAAHIAPWNENSTLRLDSLEYCYSPTSNTPIAFPDITFHGYERVCVIGPSGCGKSTLAQLLGGFISPTGGTFVLNEEPLSHLRMPAWQNQVLYIPQNPYIFHDTLRANICFYTPEADDAAIAHAIEVVGLAGLVAELPQGIDTIIGEGGRGLSGGQAQRIALARALLDTSRRILLFDEPTAHLDIETELELSQRMMPLMEGRLVVFCTHRRHWTRALDRVIELGGDSDAQLD